MANLQFYLNGVAIEPPENWRETELELSFENDSPSATVKVNSFDFVGLNAEYINSWIANGFYGGVGIYEGISFQIKACNNVLIFDGILDLSNVNNKFDCDRVTVFVRENNKIDWLNDVSDSFSFAYLASIGVITSADYIAVPYCLTSIPDYAQVAMLSITTFLVMKELYMNIYQLQTMLTNIPAAVITPNLAIAFVADLVFLLAYIVLLLVILWKLLRQLMDEIVQPDKYKYGMYVRTLFNKACSYLGLGFISSILNDPTSPYYNLMIIPQKYVIADPTKYRDLPFDEGYKSFWGLYMFNAKSYGYYDGTFGDLIRSMNDTFNGKIKVQGGILYFERFDYWNSQSSYTLPDIVQLPNGTNAGELTANYFVEFQTDDKEGNTYNKADKTNSQCILSPITIAYSQKNVTLAGMTSKTLTYALAQRKEDFTRIEFNFQIFYDAVNILYNGVYSVVDAVISGINAVLSLFGLSVNNPLPAPISINILQRKGFMMLETDFIGVPKLFIANKSGLTPHGFTEAKISYTPNNTTYLNAEYLLKNFHNHSFVYDPSTIDPSTGLPIHNQFYKYKDKEVPFCCADYLNVLGCNWIKTFDQKKAKVLKLMWSPEKDEARIDYDVKFLYTKNIKQKFITDGVEV